MANLNQLNCASDVANTGFGSCFLDMKQIVGAFIVPNGYALSAADLADIQAALIADTKAVVKLNRVFPVGNFVGVTSATEDKTVQTFPYGGKKVVREGFYDWSFQFTEGGLCLQQALRKFNSNAAWSILFYDSEFHLFGTKGLVAGSLYGIPLEILWANPWMPNDGSNSAVYHLQTVFKPRYINEELAFVPAGSYLQDIEGLQDVDIVVNTWNQTTGVVNAAISSKCGTNLGEIYSTELPVVGNFKASNKVTGAAITITSVAYVSTTKTFNITIDTADADFPATTEGVLLDLAANTVLEAAGVVGYESAGPVNLATT